MVVKKFIKDVEYPDDKPSKKHIIEEYEKVLNYKLYGQPFKNKKSWYIIHVIVIAFIYYIATYSNISIIIKSLYMIPLAVSIIYNIILTIRVKKNGINDEKIFYEFKNSEILLIIALIYGGTFAFQTVLFDKWDNKEYLVSLEMLVFFSLITMIKVRIKAPKKFIKQYLHTNNKIRSYDMIIIPIVQFLVSIAYFQKPYFFILSLSYVMLVVFSGLITYGYFEYKQYDKIQQLKKEINYIPKESKK